MGLVLDRIAFSTKELDAIKQSNLTTDKLFLIAIIKARAGEWKVAGEILAKSSDSSWMGFTDETREKVYNLVLGHVYKIPNIAEEPFFIELLKERSKQTNVHILNASGNENLFKNWIVPFTDIGFVRPNIRTGKISAPIWKKTSVFYKDKDMRRFAEIIANKVFKSSFIVQLKSTAESTTVKQSDADLVVVIAYDRKK